MRYVPCGCLIEWPRRLGRVLVPILVLPCCGEETPGSAEEPGVVRWDSAGVTVVENRLPVWGPGEGWRVGNLITSIGTMDGHPGEVLHMAVDGTRLPDGRVVLANAGTSELWFYDSGGSFLRAVGGKGEGPGEFRIGESPGLRFLTRTGEGSLLAWDLLGQEVSLFASDGEFIRSTRLHASGRMRFLRGVFRDQSILTALLDPHGADTETGRTHRQVERLVRFGPAGDSIGFIGDFPGMEFTSFLSEERSLRISPPWGKALHLATSGERIFIATGDSYEIAVLDLAGGVRMRIRRTHEPQPVRDEDVRNALERTIEQVPEHLREVLVPDFRRAYERIPKGDAFPPYQGLRADAAGYLWVREFTPFEDPPNEWAVFDPQGRWMGVVILPPHLDPVEIGNDYVLGKIQDHLGVEMFKVYALEKGPGER